MGVCKTWEGTDPLIRSLDDLLLVSKEQKELILFALPKPDMGLGLRVQGLGSIGFRGLGSESQNCPMKTTVFGNIVRVGRVTLCPPLRAFPVCDFTLT